MELCGGLRSPHCSLSIPVSLHGMAQGYAYARHEQSHRVATHKPLHLPPVYITSNIASLCCFSESKQSTILPFSIHCSFEQEGWLMVAPQLPQAPCSSSSFYLACFSAMLFAAKATMTEHQVLPLLGQKLSCLFPLSLHDTSPFFLLAFVFCSLSLLIRSFQSNLRCRC